MEVKQNTLYLTTQGSYISRDHLTLRIEVERELKLSVPIHHLESVCIFGQSSISPFALELCWEHGVAVNYFSENGYFLGRWEGVANTSVLLRRAQYRAADSPEASLTIARQCVAGKLQNSRISLLRSARETEAAGERERLQVCAEEIADVVRRLEHAESLDQVRGYEGQSANLYFAVFDLHLRQQRTDFMFGARSRRPARDAVNCLLSYLYALLRHDVIAALTATGLDPFVGYLHTERPNRPALALDLMEEFRPMLCDRLAITLINRRQIGPKDFVRREGGAVEFTPAGRKAVISAYQLRKQEVVGHPVLNEDHRLGQFMLVQARILARHLRGDRSQYLPCVLR
ncbi:MAG: type I-C CRISPR-associated endonuclease Cas1c [Acidobacteria bacterium]|nr:type I-C CRISPR-associated endonuclease Cas1c [Acidobacteriota bacterium]MCI0718576.1 type I-C CRISPR-associated endonuclease Cas1c [Acidobacteriota bacterium]